MTGERLAQMGWPYPSQPINVDFDINWDSEQSRGLVAWWPMIGSQGGWPVPDRALYRYPMTPTNGPTWVSDGERGPCILFDDGAAEYLRIAASPVAGYPFSLVCWAKSNDGAANQMAFSLGENAGNDYHGIEFRGSAGGDPIRAKSQTAVGGTDVAVAAIGYTVNIWFHIVAVFGAANDRRIYVNGGNEGTNADVAGAPVLDAASIGVSADSTPFGPFSGWISDARLYDRTLTATDAYNLHAKPWELYAPRIYQQRAYAAAPPAGAIMNQIQYSNLGADLYNGTMIL